MLNTIGYGLRMIMVNLARICQTHTRKKAMQWETLSKASTKVRKWMRFHKLWATEWINLSFPDCFSCCFGPSTYWLPHPIISLCPHGGKFQTSRLIGFKHIRLLWQCDDQIQSRGVWLCVFSQAKLLCTCELMVAIGAIQRYHYVTEFGSFTPQLQSLWGRCLNAKYFSLYEKRPNKLNEMMGFSHSKIGHPGI